MPSMTSQPSTRRDLLLYSGLLVLSFVATYGYLAIQDRTLRLTLGSEGVAALLSGLSNRQVPADSTSATAQSVASSTGNPAALDTAPTTTPDPIQEEKVAARSLAVEAGRNAVSGTTPEARRSAMIQLGAMASRLASNPEPDLLQSLESAATQAADWQIRVSAVNALIGAARQMQDPSPVTRILEQASRDPHKAVAKRASDALQSF